MKITGTIINYYFHCKRQCYLFANRINLEDNSEDVRTGKVLHEIKAKDGKNAEIKYENMVIDKAETSSDRVAGYVVCADTELEMVNKINYIDSCVAVLDPLGMDIMIHNLI